MMVHLKKLMTRERENKRKKEPQIQRPIFPTIIRSSDEGIEGTILMEQLEVETIETNAQALNSLIF